MNISFPPKRSCAEEWPLYVHWLESVHAPNVTHYDSGDLPVFAITFRGHDYAFCPFCGIGLDTAVAMTYRHPPIPWSL